MFFPNIFIALLISSSLGGVSSSGIFCEPYLKVLSLDNTAFYPSPVNFYCCFCSGIVCGLPDGDLLI
jgi:hypothetical protein